MTTARKWSLVLTVLVFVAAFRTAWIFYSRYADERARETRVEEQKRKAARDTIEMMGNGNVKILNLSLEPPIIRPGEEAELCYGASNAVSVTIEPAPGKVDPSYTRCLKVRASRDTTYKLTARDAAGHTESASLTLHVR